MERFDEEGKLIMPEPEVLKKELEHLGLYYDNAVHVHQVFCPNGHQLILDNNNKFNDMPGIKLLLAGIRGSSEVFISPYLNKRERSGGDMFKLGDRLEVRCPICSVELPIIAPCDCQWDGMYVTLSLEEDMSTKNAVCFCNIWGCPNGDVRLAGEVITEYRSNYSL